MLFKMSSASVESKHGHDRLESLKKLAMVPVQPPRNPNKPLTSFFIADILQGQKVHRCDESRGLKRPWIEDERPISSSSETGNDSDDEDEEIDVEDHIPDTESFMKSIQSPLDALFKMTNKTFEGTDQHSQDKNDLAKRDQLGLFSKSQPPKKKRKSRTAFTNQQIYELEKRFLYQKYLTPADRDEIALSLGLTNAQVITWFQNRRAKLKRDLEELKADVSAAESLGEPVNISVFSEDGSVYKGEGQKDSMSSPGSVNSTDS